jgi:hypothetical protein
VFQNALKESFAAKILSCRIPVKILRSRRHLLLDPITVKQTFLRMIYGSADLTRSIGIPECFKNSRSGGRAATAGSAEKFLTPPSQCLRHKEIGERTAATDICG